MTKPEIWIYYVSVTFEMFRDGWIYVPKLINAVVLVVLF
jgi:hypothetical protein